MPLPTQSKPHTTCLTEDKQDRVVRILSTPQKGKKYSLYEWLKQSNHGNTLGGQTTTTTSSQSKSTHSSESLLEKSELQKTPSSSLGTTTFARQIKEYAYVSDTDEEKRRLPDTPDTNMNLRSGVRRTRRIIESPDADIVNGSHKVACYVADRIHTPSHDKLYYTGQKRTSSILKDTETNLPLRQRRRLHQGTSTASIVSVNMSDVEDVSSSPHHTDTKSESEDESYHDQDDDNDTYTTQLDVDVVNFFNTASPIEMQEVLSITKEQLEIINSLRPFANLDALTHALRTTRGVSTGLITRYEEMVEGYRAVDQLINACQAMAKRARPAGTQLPTTLREPLLLAPGIELKSYQIFGVQWLVSLVLNGFGGGILADEMGLGKTAQVITFLAELTKYGKSGPHLIVVPSSTLGKSS
jgi:SNF2 family DNA or RNA helicase